MHMPSIASESHFELDGLVQIKSVAVLQPCQRSINASWSGVNLRRVLRRNKSLPW